MDKVTGVKIESFFPKNRREGKLVRARVERRKVREGKRSEVERPMCLI